MRPAEHGTRLGAVAYGIGHEVLEMVHPSHEDDRLPSQRHLSAAGSPAAGAAPGEDGGGGDGAAAAGAGGQPLKLAGVAAEPQRAAGTC